MTIANCLVLPDGVIFGADSTASAECDDGIHFYNHHQKIFEVGQDSRVGAVSWGVSPIGKLSVRTLLARLSDHNTPGVSIKELTIKLASLALEAYQSEFKEKIATMHKLSSKPAEARTSEEEKELLDIIEGLRWGVCIGGCAGDRVPCAYWFEIDATLNSPSVVYDVDGYQYFGQSHIAQRVLDGFNHELIEAVVNSGKWDGDADDLFKVIYDGRYTPPVCNIRDGLDFVHFSIYSTIKTLKFSELKQVCGGPIELAVITTDRNFRWVLHKDMDAAIFGAY